jgi:hypothetical protein
MSPPEEGDAEPIAAALGREVTPPRRALSSSLGNIAPQNGINPIPHIGSDNL